MFKAALFLSYFLFSIITYSQDDLSPVNLRKTITDALQYNYNLISEKNGFTPLPLQIVETHSGPIIGYEEVVYKYRIEKRTIPKYKYEYEEYWDYQ